MIKALIFITLLPCLALPASQSKIVGTGANDASAGTTAWTDFTNITADDAADAITGRLNDTETSQLLNGTMSGNVFTVPTGATIDSIKAEVEMQDLEGSNTGFDLLVKLIKGGTVQGNNQEKAAAIPAAITIRVYAPLDLWGLTLTPTDVNATNFGLSFRYEATGDRSEVSVDFVRLTVHYTEAAAGGQQIIMINDGR